MLSGPDKTSARRKVAIFGDTGPSVHGALYRRIAPALVASDLDLIVYLGGGESSVLLDALRDVPGARLSVFGASDAAPMEGVDLTRSVNDEEGRREIARLADGLVGLPSGLGPVTDLYLSWVARGDEGPKVPVGLLNAGKAFEVVRGFMGDVANVGAGRTDHLVQFSDSIEDLLSRLGKMMRD